MNNKCCISLLHLFRHFKLVNKKFVEMKLGETKLLY